MREEMDEKGGVGVGSGEGSENNGRVCKGELQTCHSPIIEILSPSLLCRSATHTHTKSCMVPCVNCKRKRVC